MLINSENQKIKCFTCAIFRAVFDSWSSFFNAPKPETLATQATEGPIPFPYCSQISLGELSQSQSALVSWTGTRDEPIRTVAGEAKYTVAKSIYI